MDCLSSNPEQCKEVTSLNGVANLNISASLDCSCDLCPTWSAAYPVLLRSLGWLALGTAGQVNEAALAQQTCGHFEALRCVTNVTSSSACHVMLRSAKIWRLTLWMRDICVENGYPVENVETSGARHRIVLLPVLCVLRIFQ